MSKPVIHYFPIRGRAEVLRLAIVAGGDDFDTVDVNYAEQKGDREKYPFGQCPRLVDGDIDLVQSNTIARYLARKYNLQGKTEKEICAVDMIMEGVESLRVKYVNLVYNDQLADAAKEAYWKTYFDKETTTGRNGECGESGGGGAHIQYLTNFLVKNGGQYCVGDSLTIADLCLWEIVDLHMRIFGDQIQETYPELVSFQSFISELPGIKEYLAGPKRLSEPNANKLG
ncbi:hypothetical protein VOLCADRAFT_92063 [Volvox carteri f. nagariensis]|uniref:glutathione transferase n=1 Tax=Volvox carteri f. nagariensis TaxID=3068 RepID=D8TZ07_VOLCA|nr:uncharacterized protein VOLCADRAFT_92063 [Volvox carteri f. nagariensis]EFJ47313.1 hypothetical protein VOLCADRAFT_92063 [Volvox carteri f. nagariensis]|eukprot:XP_002951502.1 hypothetical protein VOLCADRAFT_92063 [Volvox carteri f. nagariensis]